MAKNSKKKKNGVNLMAFLRGDIIPIDFIRREAGLILLVIFLMIIYIDNRYVCQQRLVRINKLQKELVDVKYRTLSLNSVLMEKSLQSQIERYISEKQSNLEIATTPPYVIK